MDDVDRIRALAASAGLHLDEDRLHALTPTYAELLELIGSIHTVELGETVPATPFRATWT